MTVNTRSARRGEAYERLLRQERLILDVTELLTEALDEKGMTRAELARQLDRTPGFVSQVLGGGRNLTLRTIADIASALSLRPSFELSSIWESASERTYESWNPKPWMPQTTKSNAIGPLLPVDTPTDLPVKDVAAA